MDVFVRAGVSRQLYTLQSKAISTLGVFSGLNYRALWYIDNEASLYTTGV